MECENNTKKKFRTKKIQQPCATPYRCAEAVATGWEAKPVYGFINQEKRHPGNKPGINQPINQLILCINWLCQDSGLRDKLANWSFASNPDG